MIQTYQGTTTIPHYPQYLKRISAMQLPYKIGFVQMGYVKITQTILMSLILKAISSFYFDLKHEFTCDLNEMCLKSQLRNLRHNFLVMTPCF